MRMSISVYWVNAECISANSDSTAKWEIPISIELMPKTDLKKKYLTLSIFNVCQ
jgi:hypothetical protein